MNRSRNSTSPPLNVRSDSLDAKAAPGVNPRLDDADAIDRAAPAHPVPPENAGPRQLRQADAEPARHRLARKADPTH